MTRTLRPTPLPAPAPATAPTVRLPPPDRVRALAAAYLRSTAARADVAALTASLTAAEVARAHRLATGTGCVDCGATAMHRERRCFTCEVAACGVAPSPAPPPSAHDDGATRRADSDSNNDTTGDGR